MSGSEDPRIKGCIAEDSVVERAKDQKRLDFKIARVRQCSLCNAGHGDGRPRVIPETELSMPLGQVTLRIARMLFRSCWDACHGINKKVIYERRPSDVTVLTLTSRNK